MGIRVIALRHAKPSNEGYADDSLRPLSEEGREKQKKLMQVFQDKQIKPTYILTSPLLRAQETAQIAKDYFEVGYEEEPSLGEYFDKGALIKRLSEFEDGSTIFLVGHAPSLAEFVNSLAGETVVPSGLAKSSAAILDFDDTVAMGKGKFIKYIHA